MAAVKTPSKTNRGQFGQRDKPSTAAVQMNETNAGGMGAQRAPSVQGFGESKLFGGSGQPKDLSGYTVNGEPLPESCWETFPVSLTDQGKESAKQEKKNIERALPSVSYQGRDRTDYTAIFDDDKKAAKFRGDLEADTEGLVIDDPMKALMKKHTPAGHRGLFMSTKKVADVGLTRGVLEYKPVLVKNDAGQMERITCGGMFLASVPEEIARKADRYYDRINQAKQIQAIEKVQEQTDQIMSDRDLSTFARRKNATDAMVGMEVEDQERGDAEMLRDVLSHE